MTATELIKEIYDKYPKVHKQIKIKYDGLKFDKAGFIHYCVEDHFINLQFLSSNKILNIPFFTLYGLLEGFFEGYGIIINIIYQHDMLEEKHYFYQHLYLNYKWIDGLLRTESKSKAKQQAILKACEMLEERL